MGEAPRNLHLIRVLQVNKFYGLAGGVERAIRESTLGLRGLVEFHVLACRNGVGAGHRATLEDVPVTWAGSLGTLWSMPLSPSFPAHLRRLARDVDLIHYHWPFPLAALAHLAVRPRAPALVTYHSDIVRQKRAAALLAPMTRAFLNSMRAVLVTSPPMAESPVLRPVRERVEVVPLGVDPAEFAPTPGVLTQAGILRRWAGGRPLIVFVGRFVPYKGLDVLLEAARGVNAVFLLVGSGPLEAGLRRRARALGLGENPAASGPVAAFHRPVSGEALAACYHAAEVVVLPSVEPSEAFGLVQVEAFLCGKPVVSTNLPTGVPYVNLDGETGLTVPPGDAEGLAVALRRLISDHDLRARLGRQGFARAHAEFTRARLAERLLSVYRRLAT